MTSPVFGISWLIEYMRNANTPEMGMAPREFSEALRDGILVEPGKFPELIQTYQSLLDRVRPDMPPELRGQRTLETIAAYALMADHDYKKEMLPTAALGGPFTVDAYFDNPEWYGPAMTAFSKYIGLAGHMLTEAVFHQKGHAKDNSVVRRFAEQLRTRGFRDDENKTALKLAGINNPAMLALFSTVESFLLLGEVPELVAILEEKYGAGYSGPGRDHDGHSREITVRPRGAIVLYQLGSTLYQGFFNKDGRPLEEQAIEIQKRLFS